MVRPTSPIASAFASYAGEPAADAPTSDAREPGQGPAGSTSVLPLALAGKKPGGRNSDMPPRQPLDVVTSRAPSLAAAEASRPSASIAPPREAGAVDPSPAIEACEAAIQPVALRTDSLLFLKLCNIFPFPRFPKPETPHIDAMELLGDQAQQFSALQKLKSQKLKSSQSSKSWENYKDKVIEEYLLDLLPLLDRGIPSSMKLQYSKLPEQFRLTGEANRNLLDKLAERQRLAQSDAGSSNAKIKAAVSKAERMTFLVLQHMAVSAQSTGGVLDQRHDLLKTVERFSEYRAAHPESAHAVDEKVADLLAEKGHVLWEAITLGLNICRSGGGGSQFEGSIAGDAPLDKEFTRLTVMAGQVFLMPYAYGTASSRRPPRAGREDRLQQMREMTLVRTVDMAEDFLNVINAPMARWAVDVVKVFGETRSKELRSQAMARMLPLLTEASESLDEMLAFASYCHVPEDQVESQLKFHGLASDWKSRMDFCARICEAYLDYSPAPKAQAPKALEQAAQLASAEVGEASGSGKDAETASSSIPPPQVDLRDETGDVEPAVAPRPSAERPVEVATAVPADASPVAMSFPCDPERLDDERYRLAWFAGKCARLARLEKPPEGDRENLAGMKDSYSDAMRILEEARALQDGYQAGVFTTRRYEIVQDELAMRMVAADHLEELIDRLDRHDRPYPAADRARCLQDLKECIGRAATLEDILRSPAVRIPSQKNVVAYGLQPRRLEARTLRDGSVEIFLDYPHADADGRKWLKDNGLPAGNLRSGSASLDYWSLHVHLPRDKFPNKDAVDFDTLQAEDLGFASFVLQSFEGLSERDTEAGRTGRGQLDEDSRRRISPRWIIGEFQRCRAAKRS